MSTNFDAVLARLEKAVIQIESYATTVAKTASHAAHNATHDSAEKSPALFDWQALTAEHLSAFTVAASRFPETQQFGAWAQTCFDHIGRLIGATSVSKKPTDAELLAFIQPIVEAVNASQNVKLPPASPFVNHLKAFQEGIASVNWVMIEPPNGLPKDVAQSGFEAADFYLIKILTDGKKKGGKEGEDYAAFATSWKALLIKQFEYVRDHFKTGLEWNPRGQPLSQYSFTGTAATSGGVPAAPGAPDVPPPPPPGAPAAPTFSEKASAAASSAAGAVAGGMGAVFGELGKLGEGVTGGLKKVTADMKAKNQKDKPTLEPKAVPSAAKPAAVAAATTTAATKPKREPRTYESKGTWFVEYYDKGTITMDKVELKESVYILGCTNTSVTIPVKCKSIQVDGCKRLTVEFKQVVSIFEIVNSDRVTAFVTDNCPSVSIDKTDGASINLSRAAVANPPQIITSKVSELNLVVPGKTDDDDPVEIPLPEQYITTYENGRIKTESVAHSAN